MYYDEKSEKRKEVVKGKTIWQEERIKRTVTR